MKLTADFELCQGHGVCVEEAPDIFTLDENTGRYPRVVILQERPDAEQKTRVELAVTHCPTRALKLLTDD